MKKALIQFLALSGAALLLLPSCKKQGTLVTSNGGKAGALTASATTLPLDKTKLNDTTKVISFNFSAANFGFSAAVTNTLQIDAAGDNWKNPTSAIIPYKVYSQGYSTAVFNALALKLNLPAGVASPINVRVMHSLSANSPPVYTNVLSLTVTPFNLTSWVYVPGAYEGWANPGPQEDSLVSVTGNGIYSGIINFSAGNNQFLILPVKGSWTNKWATNQTVNNATGAASYSVTYNGSNNFAAPAAAGYYFVTFDSNANTLTIVPGDFYSVIGDAAQGWGTDVAMKYLNDGNGNWVVTLPLISTGAFKVRQDDMWGNSWGIPKAGSAGDGVPNTLNNSSNNNITIAASGNYTVSFNGPATPLNSPPLATTTYSAVKQ